MACDCKEDIEGKLLARFKEVSSEAESHSASLHGYTIVFGETALEQKGYMEIKATANFPLKKGGMKAKTQTQNMIFTFCPFCGKKY